MNITVRAENAVPGCFRFRIRASVTTAAPSKQFSGSLVVSDPTGAKTGQVPDFRWSTELDSAAQVRKTRRIQLERRPV